MARKQKEEEVPLVSGWLRAQIVGNLYMKCQDCGKLSVPMYYRSVQDTGAAYRKTEAKCKPCLLGPAA